jgi:sulfur carrier protein
MKHPSAPVTLAVRVNGERRTLRAGTRLGDLVTSVAGAADGVAVAVNGEVLARVVWDEREVRDDDDIEIVRAVQGG